MAVAPGGGGSLSRLVRYGWDQVRCALALRFPEPPRAEQLMRFESDGDLRRWHVMSDKVFGGCSDASLSLREAGDAGEAGEAGAHAYARFSGVLSRRIQAGSKMKRAGLCGIRSDVRARAAHSRYLVGGASSLRGDGGKRAMPPAAPSSEG